MSHTPIGSMVLVYMLTLGYIDGIHGTPYIAYMDPTGHINNFFRFAGLCVFSRTWVFSQQ